MELDREKSIEIITAFAGLDISGVIQKRKELLKKYHPDMPEGDKELAQLVLDIADRVLTELADNVVEANKYQSVKPEPEPEAKPEPEPESEPNYPTFNREFCDDLPPKEQASYVFECLKAYKKKLAERGIRVALEGSWLWAYGCNTADGYEMLQFLRELGFKQCSERNRNANHAGQWYWSPTVDIRTRPRGGYRSSGKQWEVKESIGGGGTAMLH